MCAGYYERRLWRRVTRVSLSDWLAFQARIRGSKDPRLLRDRPSDGAALVCENLGGLMVVWGRFCRDAGYCVPVMAGDWSAMAAAK